MLLALLFALFALLIETLDAALVLFGSGLASEESESLDDDEDSFFFDATFLAGATTLTGSSEESESLEDDDSTFFFFCGTTAFSTVFLALLALSLLFADTLDPALPLFPLITGFASEESESESDELDSTFFFFSTLAGLTEAAFFFSASFCTLFLSPLAFLLGGASDESESEEDDETTTGFFCFYLRKNIRF